MPDEYDKLGHIYLFIEAGRLGREFWDKGTIFFKLRWRSLKFMFNDCDPVIHRV